MACSFAKGYDVLFFRNIVTSFMYLNQKLLLEACTLNCLPSLQCFYAHSSSCQDVGPSTSCFLIFPSLSHTPFFLSLKNTCVNFPFSRLSVRISPVRIEIFISVRRSKVFPCALDGFIWEVPSTFACCVGNSD